jgi:hypothetical protein
MRRVLIPAIVILCSAGVVAARPTPPSYLFVWAGDSAGKASDFLAVIDATPSSPHYGEVVASIPTGVAGAHPHHTEGAMSADGHLLANGFHAGRTWLFDLTRPLTPRIITSFGDLAGYSHPHTYVRTADGHVLATFQYRAMPGDMEMHHAGGAMSMADSVEHTTGGIVEMDERGKVIRSGDAQDASISQKHIYPYSVLPLPKINRAVSTTTDMNEADTLATAEWVQLWRLSDLKLLKSIALKPGPRGNENRFTGEPRLLPDGSVYIHTFNCGLYLLRDVGRPTPTATFVMAFEGTNCGVPLLAGHFWLQPVPDVHALVVMDVADALHPREVSRLKLGDDELPHWISMDPTGRRIVLNSGGYGKSERLYIINFNPSTGAVALDDKFRDKGSDTPGISMRGRTWPHGFVAKASPHGTVFSR